MEASGGITLQLGSRRTMLERALLFTLLCSLLGDYCGGNLPCTDAWIFFTLATLYLGGAAAQQRPVVVAFLFGAFSLLGDIFFLSMVRSAAAHARLFCGALPFSPAIYRFAALYSLAGAALCRRHHLLGL